MYSERKEGIKVDGIGFNNRFNKDKKSISHPAEKVLQNTN